MPKDVVAADARAFCEEKGLSEHTDLFVKAALVARQPDEYEALEELSPAEKGVLQYEQNHKWAGSKQLYFSMLMCAIGAACQGWDQTGSNGANLSFPVEFGISKTLDDGPGGERDSWLVGLVNSAPYASAAIVGVWLSDPLNHYLGRRGEICLTSVILAVTPIASGFTHSWQALFAVRLVMGIGLGAKAAVSNIHRLYCWSPIADQSDCPSLRCRDESHSHPRCLDHGLAALDLFRYLPGFRGQLCRQRRS